jgi:hypothetical protein
MPGDVMQVAAASGTTSWTEISTVESVRVPRKRKRTTPMIRKHGVRRAHETPPRSGRPHTPTGGAPLPRAGPLRPGAHDLVRRVDGVLCPRQSITSGSSLIVTRCSP